MSLATTHGERRTGRADLGASSSPMSSSASHALLGATKRDLQRARGGTPPMTDPTETATRELTIVTVFEHHDADGANLDVAVVRPHRWHFLAVEEARDLANKLLDAADLAEQCSQEFEVPLRTR